MTFTLLKATLTELQKTLHGLSPLPTSILRILRSREIIGCTPGVLGKDSSIVGHSQVQFFLM